MKKNSKLKLNALSEQNLERREQAALIGGAEYTKNCCCGCAYYGYGGSSTSSNRNANHAGKLP